MTIHRKTVTLTCDANGAAEESINILPDTALAGRSNSLYALSVEGDGAHITVYELEAADEDDEDASETPGAQLFYVGPETFVPGRTYFPRENLVSDEVGTLIANEYMPVFINTRKLLVAVDGAGPSEEYEATIYYESGGDLRF